MSKKTPTQAKPHDPKSYWERVARAAPRVPTPFQLQAETPLEVRLARLRADILRNLTK